MLLFLCLKKMTTHCFDFFFSKHFWVSKMHYKFQLLQAQSPDTNQYISAVGAL